METAKLSTDSLVAASTAASGIDGISAQMMLKMIFGDIAQDPMAALTSLSSGDTVLSIVFMYINIGLLTLGSVYLTYKTLAAVTQTAHDGDFIGKAFHTVWVPIRVTTGVMSLVPIAGGWNALQVVMLWIGVMGAGLGNLTWQAVVTAWMDKGVVQYAASAAGSGGTTQKTNVAATLRFGNSGLVASKTFEALLCNESFLATDTGGHPNNGPYTFDGGGADCGSVSVADQGGVLGVVGGNSQTRTDSVIGIGGATLAANVEAATQTITSSMITDMRAVAKEAVNEVKANLAAATDPNAPQKAVVPDFNKYLVRVNTIGATYQTKINAAVYSILNGASAADKMSGIVEAAANNYGFVSAGSFYTAYANSSYAIKGAGDTNGMVDVKVNTISSSSDTLYKEVMNKYSAAKGKSAASGATSDSSDSEQGAFKLLKDKMGFGGDNLINWFIHNDETAPALVNIKNTADNVVMFAGVGITGIGAIMGAKEGLEKVPGVGALVSAASGAMTPWLEMIKFVMQISLGFFLMCSIYLPLVPYIVFMGQVMEWLASVMLGVAAAPFLAFAHFDTDGEGLGQRTQHGYSFMLQSFMRPVMLILGFVLASAMLEVSIYFLTATYGFAVADAQVHSVTGLFSVLAYCALYMGLAVGLVNTSCSLMYKLPDAILDFMGVRSVGLGFGHETANNAGNIVAGGVGVARVPVGGLKTPGGKANPANPTNPAPGGGGVLGTGGTQGGVMQNIPKP